MLNDQTRPFGGRSRRSEVEREGKRFLDNGAQWADRHMQSVDPRYAQTV